MDRALLNNLHQIGEFQLLLKELKTMRPNIPQYNHKEDNIEDIKHISARQQEFDKIMFTINPFKDV